MNVETKVIEMENEDFEARLEEMVKELNLEDAAINVCCGK